MKFNGIPAQHIYYVAVLVFIYRYVFVTLSILAQSILAHMRFGSSARGHGDTATPPRPSHDALDSATMAAAAARLQTVPLALQAAYRDARCARRFEGRLVAAVPGNGGGFGRADCRMMLVSHLGLLKTRMGVVRHMKRPRARRRKRQCSPRPRRRRRGLRAARRRWYGGMLADYDFAFGLRLCFCAFSCRIRRVRASSTIRLA